MSAAGDYLEATCAGMGVKPGSGPGEADLACYLAEHSDDEGVQKRFHEANERLCVVYGCSGLAWGGSALPGVSERRLVAWVGVDGREDGLEPEAPDMALGGGIRSLADVAFAFAVAPVDTANPLAPLVRAWLERPRPAAIERRQDTRIVPRIVHVETRPERAAGARLAGAEPAGGIPVVGPDDPAKRVAILDVVDAAGVPIRAKRGGAALEARLFVAALSSVVREDRHELGTSRIAPTVRELRDALFPGGWNRRQDLPRLARALDEAGRYAIIVGRFYWHPLSLVSWPRAPNLDDPVVIDLRFPPGSRSGPVVDLPVMRGLSVKSAARWRAYIASHSVAWWPGRTRVPAPDRGGRLVGDESVVASVSLHRDELSAHVQAVVVPVRDGKLGWCRVRDAAAVRLAPQVQEAREKVVGRGEDAPKLSTRTRYGVLQDALYYRVSRQFGLSRGQVGSEAKHVEIDRAAAAEARVGHALYETEQARAAAKEAAADADASRRARTEYHDQAVENVTKAQEARQDRTKAERERDTARTELDKVVGELAAFNERGPWVRRVHQERELRQREQADAERGAKLDHKQSELNERGEQVAKEAAEVERRQADLAAGEAKLKEDRVAVAAERRQADETRKTADAVFRTAARRREMLKSLALDVRDSRQELARREADFAAEQEAFEPARRKLAADRRAVEEREETIRRDQATLNAREEAVQGLEHRETALRSAQAAVQVERERLTAERAAAGKIGAQALRGRREVAAQREELGNWERQIGAHNRRQEQREEQQVRTADELAAGQREINVAIDRMQRQRERLLARLLRWREMARRLRARARQLANRERAMQRLEVRERKARAILDREADLADRERAVQKLEERDRNLEARERRAADDAAKAAADRQVALEAQADATQMLDIAFTMRDDVEHTKRWADAKRIIATSERWVTKIWASAGSERQKQAVQSLRDAWTEAMRAPPPRAVKERERGRGIGE